jgi:GrpB-like predicted nucleotidyltransferase (UPF0157 family)
LDERFDPAIRIVDHDPAWRQLARAELDRLGAVLGPLAVRLEHVGSTSVPGLAAKPILDLLVSVARLEDRTAYVAPLSQLGYTFIPDPESPDLHFFAKPMARPRSHHLHVCAAGGRDELRTLAVRDFLSAHPDEAERYASLKRALAAAHPEDRLAYIAGKMAFMGELEAHALGWQRGRRPVCR